MRTGVASPLTTSAGRLFDAVAALCGIRAEVNYEGQAAVELEAAVDPAETGAYPLPVSGGQDGPLLLDARATVRAVAEELEDGAPVHARGGALPQRAGAGTATACERAVARLDISTVVLSGGVFQNRHLLTTTAALLGDAGLRVLTPELLPPNDGGIAFGQLAVAAARVAAEEGGRDVRA